MRMMIIFVPRSTLPIKVAQKYFMKPQKDIRMVTSLNFNAATLFVSSFLETNKINPFAEILPCLKAGVIKKPLFIAIFSICHY